VIVVAVVVWLASSLWFNHLLSYGHDLDLCVCWSCIIFRRSAWFSTVAWLCADCLKTARSSINRSRFNTTVFCFYTCLFIDLAILLRSFVIIM
jgi:hypothetical protein